MLYDYRFTVVPGDAAAHYRDTIEALGAIARDLGHQAASDGADQLLVAAPTAMIHDWGEVLATNDGYVLPGLFVVETDAAAVEAVNTMLIDLSTYPDTEQLAAVERALPPFHEGNPREFINLANALSDHLTAGPTPDDWTLLQAANTLADNANTTVLGTPQTWEPETPVAIQDHQVLAAGRQRERFAALFTGSTPEPVTALTSGPWQLRDGQDNPLRLFPREEHWQRRLEDEPRLTSGNFHRWPEALRQQLAAVAVSHETNYINAVLASRRPPNPVVPDTDRWDPEAAAVIGPPRVGELPRFEHDLIAYAEPLTARELPSLQQGAVERFVYAVSDRARLAGWTVRATIEPPAAIADAAAQQQWVTTDAATLTAFMHVADPDDTPPSADRLAATLHQLAALSEPNPEGAPRFTPAAVRALGTAQVNTTPSRHRP